MPETNIDTAELRKMVDQATKRAIDKHLADFKAMASDVSEIKSALLGDGYNPSGIIYKVNTMWNDYIVSKWVISFLGISTLAGVVTLAVLINEVFFR
jgi:hypothetical protein